MPHPLEYEESDGSEDLFGSDDDLPAAFREDTRLPVGVASASRADAGNAKRPRSSSPDSPPRHHKGTEWDRPKDKGKDKGKGRERDYNERDATSIPKHPTAARPTQEQRMVELRRKRWHGSPSPEFGVRTLRAFAMDVIRANASRIWDIGSVEYEQVAGLLDEVPREQLNEIENLSPHIKKDTDWLWEGFLLTEYPVFYEQCRDRKGEPRTSGWRRMYEKAAKDAEERRQQAMSRVAERYKQLEAERASKRIVVMDTLVAPKRGTRKHTLSTARRGAHAAAAHSSGSKAQNAINRARADAQRARVALTATAGQHSRPPLPAVRAPHRRPPQPDNTFSVSHLTGASSAPMHCRDPVTGPRIPAPGRRAPAPTVSAPSQRPTAHNASAAQSSSSSSTFPSAYPTSEAATRRAALPSHLRRDPSPPRERFRIEPKAKEPERFRIDPKPPREQPRRPKVESFVPPAQPKPKRQAMDFFSAPGKIVAASVPKRTEEAKQSDTHRQVVKRKSTDGPAASPEKRASVESGGSGNTPLKRRVESSDAPLERGGTSAASTSTPDRSHARATANGNHANVNAHAMTSANANGTQASPHAKPNPTPARTQGPAPRQPPQARDLESLMFMKKPRRHLPARR